MITIDYTNMPIKVMTKERLGDDINDDKDTSGKATFAFYKEGDMLCVAERDQNIPFPYENIREKYGNIEVMPIRYVEIFITRTMEILKSRFANDYLTELIKNYPNNHPMKTEAITPEDGNTASLRYGFVVGWSEDSETITFMSMKYNDADNDNINNEEDSNPVTAMMTVFSYMLFTHSHSPMLREMGGRISKKYMNLLGHDIPSY